MNAIEVRGLARSFGHVRAVDGLDLDVPQGKVFGYLGPNGAGKTTTLHMLLGILPADAGSAHVLGMDVRKQAIDVRRRSGVLLEHDGIYERLSARDNLVFHARQFGLAREDARHRADEMLASAGWQGRGDEPAGNWSRGMKRRLGVLRAFLTRPELVFLDEPTSGFDPKVAADLRGFLHMITRDAGTTVFLTTHNMQEAEAMCDEVAVLRAGKIVAQGPPGSLGDDAPRLHIAGNGFTATILANLRRRREISGVASATDGIDITLHDDVAAAPIVASLVRAGVAIEGVERRRSSLEDEFIALMEAP